MYGVSGSVTLWLSYYDSETSRVFVLRLSVTLFDEPESNMGTVVEWLWRKQRSIY